MLNKQQLEEVMTSLGVANVNWFFYKLTDGFEPLDLLELPTNYTQKISYFISSHDFVYLKELDPKDFVEQSTGEKLSKVVKMIEVEKKKQSLEQDFI